MKTMQWLIKREFWENKGMFVLAPVILASAMMLILFITLGLGNNLQNLQVSYSGNSGDGDVETKTVNVTGSAVQSIAIRVADTLGNNYMAFAAPIFMMLAIVIFFYCLNSLYDERRDRSILFWKSLPVSDSVTVLSKLVTAALIIPLIAIAVSFVTSFLALVMGCIAFSFKGIHLLGLVFGAPEVYLAPMQLLAMVPIYLVWALPTLGWLMMVSSWARSKVFLWAVGVPLLSAMLLGWMQKMFGFDWNVHWYLSNIVGRILLGVIPGGWTHVSLGDQNDVVSIHHHGGLDLANILRESWMALGTAEMLIGAVAGAIMIGVAIYMRRWREQV